MCYVGIIKYQLTICGGAKPPQALAYKGNKNNMEDRKMKFEEIFSAMKELASEGNEFFADAVAQFESATQEEKENMMEWLEGQFSDYDHEMWSVKTFLMCMSFSE